MNCRRIKHRDCIFDRTFCGGKDADKKLVMLTLRAFAKETQWQSVIRFRVITIGVRAVRLTLCPNEQSLEEWCF
jgi:hypothetical protein